MADYSRRFSSALDGLKETPFVSCAVQAGINTLDRIAPVRDGLFLFGSNAGYFYGDNTRYLYEWVLENEPAIEPVWMTKSQQVHDRLTSEGKPVEMITSRSGVSNLLKAETAFFTHSTADIAPDSTLVPASLRLVNLRHGESVKNTHLCPANSELVSESKIAQSKRWRRQNVVIASTSVFVSEIQQRCLGVSEDQSVITGYPRHDPLWTNNYGSSSTIAHEHVSLESESVERIVLYAPTWRQYAPAHDGNCHTEFFPFEDFDSEELATMLDERDTALLLRPHPHDLEYEAVQRRIGRIEKECPNVQVVGPEDLNDVYEIITAVDALITDYSSLYHDYLILDRPIVLIPYDYETFKQEVGFVYDYRKMAPGPSPTTWTEFKRALENALTGDDAYETERSVLRDILYEHQNGRACQRLIDRI